DDGLAETRDRRGADVVDPDLRVELADRVAGAGVGRTRRDLRRTAGLGLLRGWRGIGGGRGVRLGTGAQAEGAEHGEEIRFHAGPGTWCGWPHCRTRPASRPMPGARRSGARMMAGVHLLEVLARD